METEPTDKIKARLGRIATFAWLIGGVVLLVYDGGVRGLLTMKALAFLGIGMFVAAIVIGLLTYKLFVHFADKAAFKAGQSGGHPRDPILHVYRQTRIVAGLAGLIFVFWVYASFFWV